MDISGAALSRAYYEELVGPAIAARWPGLPHAAGRLGSGSDVLGLDDAVSRDHDWGLRVNLLVPPDVAGQADAYLDMVLPDLFGGYPTRYATTWDPQVRHRVQTEDVGTFVASRTGITASDSLSVTDWLSLTGQAVLEVTAGPVFVDTAAELTAAREHLAWYPHDLWVYVVATDWVAWLRSCRSSGEPRSAGTTSAPASSHRAWSAWRCTWRICSSGAGLRTPSGLARA